MSGDMMDSYTSKNGPYKKFGDKRFHVKFQKTRGNPFIWRNKVQSLKGTNLLYCKARVT